MLPPAPSRRFSPASLATLQSRAAVTFVDATRGFGLVAARDFAYDTCIVQNEAPFAALLDAGQSSLICARCWRLCDEAGAKPCQWECGLNYCCETCLQDHAEEHKLLCTGRVDSEAHPLVRFKRHALETNPHFIMAAQLVVKLLLSPASMELELENFDRPLWHEALAASEPAAVREAVRELARASRELLRQALVAQFPDARAVDACLGMEGEEDDTWLRLMGMFERNQFVVQFPADGEEDNDQDTVGTGVFSVLCQANHSCDPNAEIVFSDSNLASLRLLRSVKAGEELCVSYIDEELESAAERRAALADYGFVCSCSRCVEEDEDEDAANAGSAGEEKRVPVAAELSVLKQALPPGFSLTRICGVDVSYVKDSSDAVACLVVLDYPSLRVVHTAFAAFKAEAPYASGHLAQREGQVLVGLVLACKERIDLVLVDGCGVMHPHGFGLACHVGVKTGKPAVGVSKTLLCVDGIDKDVVSAALRAGEGGDLVGKSGRTWGRALVAGKNTKSPVYVSVGHLVDLAFASDVVRQVCVYRVPEPIRQADLRGRQFLRDLHKA
jgi:deoxyinosine 3'endonuclease (endonuclease V)